MADAAYLILIADCQEAVAESNETNNQIAIPVQIEQPPLQTPEPSAPSYLGECNGWAGGNPTYVYLSIDWPSVPGALSYEVEIQGATYTTTENSYVYGIVCPMSEGCAPFQTHCYYNVDWRVRAAAGTIYSPWSEIQSSTYGVAGWPVTPTPDIPTPTPVVTNEPSTPTLTVTPVHDSRWIGA